MCRELGGGRCQVAVFMVRSLPLHDLCAVQKEQTGRKGGRERLFILQFRFLGEDAGHQELSKWNCPHPS